nr:immunoglobulin heavy chain junction region [Macaca mulatta]MOV39169.1 immunoglobulin heavy chain junction region [Macaca mulatta]MOV39522.1 immunoglobulin heavy chain junction region [Macaca mulatta]MOV39608.1 immunoglobulin heavy chain junction region [Macaca mulatta]MOV40084.1 immunoglobulin heavy chain junction region [Macaca mulatta]
CARWAAADFDFW